MTYNNSTEPAEQWLREDKADICLHCDSNLIVEDLLNTIRELKLLLEAK